MQRLPPSLISLHPELNLWCLYKFDGILQIKRMLNIDVQLMAQNACGKRRGKQICSHTERSRNEFYSVDVFLVCLIEDPVFFSPCLVDRVATRIVPSC